MPEHVSLDVASLSHPGMVRSHNEDAIFVDANAGIAVLADGMGGYTFRWESDGAGEARGDGSVGNQWAEDPAEMRKLLNSVL